MHTNQISPARKIFLSLIAAIGLVLMTGCEAVTLTNLTPNSLPENPSQIYTITLRTAVRGGSVVASTVEPHIVIDGRNYKLTPSSLGQGLYEFEYQLPAGRTDLAYYFLVYYQTETNGVRTDHETYTELTRASIVGRYVLSLEVNRGPVGARVSILGRGFTPQDVVYLDGTPARTAFESPNALSFFVPAVEAGRNYRVMLGKNGMAETNSLVGTFRVDGSTLSIDPSSLTLNGGQTQAVTFTIPNAAPAGGLLLDVTTDVPESVIMPEVIVPAGANSVTINVQGGKPGSGSLFLKGYGSGELSISVTVR